MFAGPNGSGKTTIIKKFPKEIPLGYYVNADDIGVALRDTGKLNLVKYGVRANTEMLQEHFLKSGFAKKRRSPVSLKNIKIEKNYLFVKKVKVDSYFAADIADFLRQQLLMSGKSFSFETVMSHPSKLEMMREARKNGYRVYLYFVATDDVDINLNRVKVRVKKNGHDVHPQKIRNRYSRTLNLLYDAVKLTNRAYIFDNSGKYYELVAEVTEGKKVQMLDIDKKIPYWFIKYFYQKAREKK